MNGHIYIIQLAGFQEKNHNVYKIGMTEQANINKRLRGYDRGKLLLFSEYTSDVKNKEKEILKIFNEKFTPYKEGDYEFSKEYFTGDINHMKQVIYDYCNPTRIEEQEKQDTNRQASGRFWKMIGY